MLLHEMPQVTIAAINGACAGAGLGWACACDLRYAVADAKFNTAFLDVAVAGDMGLPWTLPRIVGAGRARELSLLPRKLDAATRRPRSGSSTRCSRRCDAADGRGRRPGRPASPPRPRWPGGR